MALITRGKLKGHTCRLMQWCNDWFMVEPGGIMSPRSLKLDPDEIDRVRSHNNNGFLMKLFTLRDDGTFLRNRTFSEYKGGE